jgi:hypothetical protein
MIARRLTMLLEELKEEVKISDTIIRSLVMIGMTEAEGKRFFIRTLVSSGANSSEESPFVVLETTEDERFVVTMKDYMEAVSNGVSFDE